MNEHKPILHLDAEAFQALLDGDLPAGELARAREHLAACPRCEAELDGWREFLADLDRLPSLAPSPALAERVMRGVAPGRIPLAARVRGWIRAGSPQAHPTAERLQDLAEGVLAGRAAARVRTHLDACPACASEAEAWRATFARLGSLERLAPPEGFGQRVMAGVRIPAPAPVRVPEWRQALAWAGRLVPQTRQAWAAVSGVALTPAVTLALVLWTVFSHPTLTPGALASFVGWKAAEAAAWAWSAVASAALESAGLFKVYSLIESLALSPAALAGAVAALCLGTVAASWVLYRNLVVAHPLEGQVAHARVS